MKTKKKNAYARTQAGARKRVKMKRAMRAAGGSAPSDIPTKQLERLYRSLEKAEARGKSRKNKEMQRRNKSAAAHRHRNPLVTAVVEGIGLAAGLKAFDVASKALSRGKKNPIPLALLQGLEFGAGETAVAKALQHGKRRKSVKKKKQSKKRKGVARRRPQPRKKAARKRNPAKRITHAVAVGTPRNIVEVGTRAQVERTKKILRRAGVKRILLGRRVR